MMMMMVVVMVVVVVVEIVISMSVRHDCWKRKTKSSTSRDTASNRLSCTNKVKILTSFLPTDHLTMMMTAVIHPMMTPIFEYCLINRKNDRIPEKLFA